jgi:hypothetical protein
MDGSYSEGSKQAFKAVLSALTYAYENGHPSIFGYDYIAQTLSRWIFWRMSHVVSLPHPLPAPSIPLLNSTTSSLVQLIDSKEKFMRHVTFHRGFEWRIEAVNKPGWISERFGSLLEVRLPVSVASGFISIGFLQTYSPIGLFNLTVTNVNHLVSNRRVVCVINKKFSQTAFVTIPFNVTSGEKVFHLRFEHIDHTDSDHLFQYDDMLRFILNFKRNYFEDSTTTKVKIISIGIYDSADGLASRPREVDYNVE